MLSHEEMVSLQAEKHELIKMDQFQSIEEYNIHLIHTAAYEQAAKFAENKIILDLGCNTGYGSWILSKTSKKVIGVDVSSKAIVAAKDLYDRNNLKFHTIDGKRLPFDENKFDLIISCQVIEHIVNHNDYISEIKRALSPNGLVIFTTPNASIRLDPGMKPWNPFHVREFNASEIKDLLTDYFKEVTVYGLFASEPLYSIELKRVELCRENSRKIQRQEQSIFHSLKLFIKKLLPHWTLHIIAGSERALISALRKKKKSSNSIKDFKKKYTTAEFYYKTDNLDEALDFFILCGRKGTTHNPAKAKK